MAIRAAKSRLEAQQRAADDARGRQPDQDRNPKGGQPYKRSYGEPDAKAQSNFTDPESGIMKTSNDGFQQCYNAQVGRWCAPVGGGDGGDGVPALLDALAETVGEQDGAGGRRLQQRAGLGGPGNARHRRVCVLAGRGRRPGPATRRSIPRRVAWPRSCRGRRAVRRMQNASGCPPNGWIARAGIPFSLRGLAKVQGEWDLVCLALNTKRLHALLAA